MPKPLPILIAAAFLLNIVSVSAQQMPKPMPLTLAGTVNFKALADYQLLHPIKHKRRSIEQIEDKDKGPLNKTGKVDSTAITFNVSLPKILSRSTSPAPNIVFNGTIDNGSLIPPDVNASCGQTYIVTTTNQEFDIFTKTGTLNSTLDIGSFFTGVPSTFYSDPHVIYDATNDRYVIVILDILQDGDGGLAVGVSQTGDPTGSWYTYSFDNGINDNLDFLDYPLLGSNTNWIVVTGNLFLGSGGISSQIYVFNKADLYAGTLGTVNTFSDNNVSDTYAPALTFDNSQTTEYIVADDNGNDGGNGYIYIGTVTGTADAPVYQLANTLGINSTWAESEVDATQNGGTGTITTDDTRVGNAVYRNGSLWFAHTVYLPADAPTYSGVDWWQIDPSKPDVLQYGRLSDPTGQAFYYFPSICVDPSNNALLGYTTSSPSNFASAGYSFRTSTDAKNTMEGSYIYQPGLTYYYKTFGSGRNRFGDFSFTFIDPVDNSFWTNEEFAYTPTNTWATTLANVSGVPCNAQPTAGTVTASLDTLCGGEGVTLNLLGSTESVIGIRTVWQQSLNGLNAWQHVTGGIGDSTQTYYTTPSPSIIYYRCVVTCAFTGQSDTTAPVEVVVPGVVSISTNIPDSICTPGNYTITANTIGTPVNWYANSTTGTTIATGDVLNATITKDTTFYVSTGHPKYETLGIPNNSGTGSYFNYTFNDGLQFRAITGFILDSVSVYASSTGNVTINLVDSATGLTVSTVTAAITANEVRKKTVIATDFNCQASTTYNITALGSTVDSLYRTSAGTNYPYVVTNVVSINGASNGAQDHYYFFYDWHILGGCVSERLPVHVNFYTIPLVITATPDTLCAGSKDSVLLTVSGPATSFDWVNNNSPQTSFYAKPTTDSTFTVNATNARGCSGTASVTVYVPDCAAGINQVSGTNSSIEVYPNPTTGDFDMIMYDLPKQDYTVSAYNMLSQKIMERVVTVNSAQYKVSMTVSDLPSGVYFIQVVHDSDEWTKPIIKR